LNHRDLATLIPAPRDARTELAASLDSIRHELSTARSLAEGLDLNLSEWMLGEACIQVTDVLRLLAKEES